MLFQVGCDRNQQALWAYLHSGEAASAVARVLGDLPGAEAAILQTCHRWECFGYAPGADLPPTLRERLLQACKGGESLAEQFRIRFGPAAVEHLMRVTAGLESPLIGEHEIAAQVKECFREARREGRVGPMLDLVFRNALAAGKKVRQQTAIASGNLSYPGLVWQIIRAHAESPPGRALLIGTGNLARGIAEILAVNRIQPHFIAGRNPERAAELARHFDGGWSPPSELPRCLEDFQVVIGVSGAGRILISGAQLAGLSGPRLLIELSSPPVIAPPSLEYPGLAYYGLNDLKQLAARNMERRQSELPRAELIIAAAVSETVLALYQREQELDIAERSRQIIEAGQLSLETLLRRVEDERLQQELERAWAQQLRKLVYLSIANAKNEALRPAVPLQNHFFPVVVSLKAKPVLIVGGGKVATRKIQRLLEANAVITVVAPKLAPELGPLAAAQRIQWRAECFRPEHLAGAALVIAATDDPDVNRRIVGEARRRNLWVSSAADAADSDFIFPAIIRRGDLLVAISTSGKNPAIARKLRLELESLFGPELEDLNLERDAPKP
ncbi:glutamyl-tRNA reductase [Hydrogenispora ethanolica]|uniref:Glutamyl-tRNA reductase n=1 Tax=Hydrogenispora ethanolica TaxID=1082276 RepID=A0A4R1S482_HYDET|nr:glutamyl-tRNA reductase [Hydrogenispora ethanolica]